MTRRPARLGGGGAPGPHRRAAEPPRRRADARTNPAAGPDPGSADGAGGHHADAQAHSARAGAPGAASPGPAPSPGADRGPAIVAEALKYLGAPYIYGGATPAGWDCSGMIQYVFKRVTGVTLPRTSQQQYTVGRPVAPGDIRPGDLVFFANTAGPGITHNGIALGDGRFIHARSEGYGTVITSLADPYWSRHYAGARRP